MNKTLKYLLIIAGALIIIVIIAKSFGLVGKEILIKVSTEEVQNRTITETIIANGKIQPKTEVKISADVSGEIIELYVEDGDSVTKGQLLLKINPDIYFSTIERLDASVNSSKAQLAQSEATLLEKEKTHSRNTNLWNKKAISDAEYESSEIAYKIALANKKSAGFSVKSAEASLKEANENLTKTQIYSPMYGIVTKLNVELGERVVGTAQMTGTEIMRIANLNNMEVQIDVNENDIVRVSKNDTALIEVDAYLGKKFKGLVTEIANSASTEGTSTDQVTNFEVKIKLLPKYYKELVSKNNPFPFRPGMSASVEVQTKTVNNVLSIPIQSVTTRTDSLLNDSLRELNNDEIKEIVFIYKDNKVFIKNVETGVQNNNYIEIISGVKINDEVVIAPYSAITKKLKDDMKVEKVSKDKLF
jgi:HlyD family secretion protein